MRRPRTRRSGSYILKARGSVESRPPNGIGPVTSVKKSARTKPSCPCHRTRSATFVRAYHKPNAPLGPGLALGAALTQEALDLADEVVPRREPLLVDQQLESLHVLPGGLLEGGRGVEARPQLLRFFGEV